MSPNTDTIGYKNRFRLPSPDGYRDLQFKLMMGGHVCELQLQLRTLADTYLSERWLRTYKICQRCLFAPDVTKDTCVANFKLQPCRLWHLVAVLHLQPQTSTVHGHSRLLSSVSPRTYSTLSTEPTATHVTGITESTHHACGGWVKGSCITRTATSMRVNGAMTEGRALVHCGMPTATCILAPGSRIQWKDGVFFVTLT